MLAEIERVLQEQVRPQLALHGGNIRALSFENGLLRFELLGRCAACPAAAITTEELVRTALTQALPQVKGVALVEAVDEALLAQARAILGRHSAP